MKWGSNYLPPPLPQEKLPSKRPALLELTHIFYVHKSKYIISINDKIKLSLLYLMSNWQNSFLKNNYFEFNDRFRIEKEDIDMT